MKVKILLTTVMLLTGLLAQAEGFKKNRIKINNKTIQVEVADTDATRQQGLMLREEGSLAPDAGMLFIFEQEQPLSFWMKNTFIKLSIGYFDKNRVLIDIQDMVPVKNTVVRDLPVYRSSRPAQYALEVNKGWFRKNKINLGSKFEFLGPDHRLSSDRPSTRL